MIIPKVLLYLIDLYNENGTLVIFNDHIKWFNGSKFQFWCEIDSFPKRINQIFFNSCKQTCVILNNYIHHYDFKSKKWIKGKHSLTITLPIKKMLLLTIGIRTFYYTIIGNEILQYKNKNIQNNSKILQQNNKPIDIFYLITNDFIAKWYCKNIENPIVGLSFNGKRFLIDCHTGNLNKEYDFHVNEYADYETKAFPNEGLYCCS